VEEGTVVREIEFTGHIVPVVESQLYFQTAGYVDKVYVTQGQLVKAGDVLAELGGEYLENQIASAELELALAQARLAEAENENTLQIALGEIALTLAREEFTRTVFVEEHVAQAGVDRAETELAHLRKGVSPTLAVQVQQAQLVLDRLKDASKIVAQRDGFIASVLAFPGQLVEPVQPIIVVSYSEDVEVRAFPTQEQLTAMYESQPVTVRRLYDEERTWDGEIRHLLTGYSSMYSVSGPAVLDSSTRITISGDTDDVNLGETVLVNVILEQRDDVLWLPSDAIRTFQGSAFVIAMVEGGQRRVDVETGIVGQDRVEITSGLVKGQVVIAP
jgi:macrolide-specific efflux system membrane fusion protein